MLTLATGSVCDVCAEEYGPQCLPHSIPCGHVLCSSCATTIAEKTPPRLKPVCPFCREEFLAQEIRLIRIDFNNHAAVHARRMPTAIAPSKSESAADVWTRKTDKLPYVDAQGVRSRDEARKLEDKVAKVASKKSSVEEVSNLHKELEDWLTAAKTGDQASSLYLSAALLRAILMNHVAHSEATKTARATEASLKARLDDTEMLLSKTQAELRRCVTNPISLATNLTDSSYHARFRQREQNALENQEAQNNIRAEVPRKSVSSRTSASASSSAAAAATASPSGRGYTSPGSPPPAGSTPSPASPYSPSTASPLSRYNSSSGHARSSSTSASRPVTPSTRSHTPSVRSPTTSMSSSSARGHLATPPVPPMPRPSTAIPSHIRFPTPGPTPQPRSQTPAAPRVPTKPRRLSQPSPPKIARTLSDEKHEIHQRWIPPSSDIDYPVYPKTGSSQKYTSASSATAATHRVRSPPATLST
ncbi:hypothetical protein CYLTODRAFT_55692 [Cylindrobasidium torrendii FP15055 ss-10]|uniref:RING-type domain-containing protein n=1 Tax=Cylindrobasidium torrendii FP15055 ss-10 TaxID=1314674 RepID=A0A0D7BP12_9AGAR|nr:hypothetical protein CYLTODRAFT_55692 [Cylindrobasidium torrendii FP15055 ss-10]